jgi:uncharacterized Zn finger protein (UPF0148 family)
VANWAVICPNCRREFTHTEIREPVAWRTQPFGVLPKPSGKRTCPHCGTESVFESHQLFYAKDADET